MNSHEVLIHIHQGCFAGTGAIVRLPQCQWSKPDGYGKISQCITTTKHSKAKTVCIFLGIYCNWQRYRINSPAKRYFIAIAIFELTSTRLICRNLPFRHNGSPHRNSWKRMIFPQTFRIFQHISGVNKMDKIHTKPLICRYFSAQRINHLHTDTNLFHKSKIPMCDVYRRHLYMKGEHFQNILIYPT